MRGREIGFMPRKLFTKSKGELNWSRVGGSLDRPTWFFSLCLWLLFVKRKLE